MLELGLLSLGLYLAGWGARKLGVSPVVGYLLLGILLGPHGLAPVYRLGPVTELLGELGLVLLLFFLGLEFSLGRLLEGARPTLVAGGVDLAQLALGTVLGWGLGFGWLGGLFLGAIMYVSSSGVIARLLSDSELLAYPEAERTLGVLVFEDLAMVAVLIGLGLAASSGGAWAFAGAALFLALYGLLARFGGRWLRRLLAREEEALALVALALVALVPAGAVALRFPAAVAAFLLGTAVAESGQQRRVEVALRSWYEVAAAVFFAVVGMRVDLAGAVRELPLALLMAAVTTAMSLVTGFVGGRASGLGRRASLGHGLMLLPRGEFSLVIAGLAAEAAALSTGAGRALLGATSVYVVLMVTLGSLAFARFEAINERLARLVETPAERARRRARQEALDSVSLDSVSLE